MEIFLIHDTRNPEKLELCRLELQRQEISEYWRIVPKHRDTVVESINAAHKEAVTIAKHREWEEVCIMEDDVQFPAVDGWEYFLSKKPETYDLYLSCTYGGTQWYLRSVRGGTDTRFTSPPVGFHCYFIHSKYYDTFLSVPDDAHIDVAQGDTGADIQICYPFAAIQRPGWSANARKEVNYNHNLKPGDVYGWL